MAERVSFRVRVFLGGTVAVLLASGVLTSGRSQESQAGLHDTGRAHAVDRVGHRPEATVRGRLVVVDLVASTLTVRPARGIEITVYVDTTTAISELSTMGDLEEGAEVTVTYISGTTGDTAVTVSQERPVRTAERQPLAGNAPPAVPFDTSDVW